MKEKKSTLLILTIQILIVSSNPVQYGGGSEDGGSLSNAFPRFHQDFQNIKSKNDVFVSRIKRFLIPLDDRSDSGWSWGQSLSNTFKNLSGMLTSMLNTGERLISTQRREKKIRFPNQGENVFHRDKHKYMYRDEQSLGDGIPFQSIRNPTDLYYPTPASPTEPSPGKVYGSVSEAQYGVQAAIDSGGLDAYYSSSVAKPVLGYPTRGNSEPVLNYPAGGSSEPVSNYPAGGSSEPVSNYPTGGSSEPAFSYPGENPGGSLRFPVVAASYLVEDANDFDLIGTPEEEDQDINTSGHHHHGSGEHRKVGSEEQNNLYNIVYRDVNNVDLEDIDSYGSPKGEILSSYQPAIQNVEPAHIGTITHTTRGPNIETSHSGSLYNQASQTIEQSGTIYNDIGPATGLSSQSVETFQSGTVTNHINPTIGQTSQSFGQSQSGTITNQINPMIGQTSQNIGQSQSGTVSNIFLTSAEESDQSGTNIISPTTREPNLTLGSSQSGTIANIIPTSALASQNVESFQSGSNTVLINSNSANQNLESLSSISNNIVPSNELIIQSGSISNHITHDSGQPPTSPGGNSVYSEGTGGEQNSFMSLEDILQNSIFYGDTYRFLENL